MINADMERAAGENSVALRGSLMGWVDEITAQAQLAGVDPIVHASGLITALVAVLASVLVATGRMQNKSVDEMTDTGVSALTMAMAFTADNAEEKP